MHMRSVCGFIRFSAERGVQTARRGRDQVSAPGSRDRAMDARAETRELHARPATRERRAEGNNKAQQSSVAHLPVCYRYFDCFDSFSGWYGMAVLQVVFDSLIFVRHLIV